MTMQIVSGQIKYAPSRDLMYLWPDVLRNVADRLEDAPFKPLHDLLTERGVTLDDLGEAAAAYSRFVRDAHNEPEKNMVKCLDDSGWNKVRPEAQIAYMFYAGSIITGVFWKGIRDATPEGGDIIPQVKSLMSAGRQLDAYIALTGWRRWLYRWSKTFKRLLFRSKGIHTEV